MQQRRRSSPPSAERLAAPFRLTAWLRYDGHRGTDRRDRSAALGIRAHREPIVAATTATFRLLVITTVARSAMP
jgi:hypothetical protein